MLLKCLTVDQPINQAMLASMSNEREECEDYIVVVTDVNVHFFSFHGQDISRALPFHGAHVWSLNPGLLIHVSQFVLPNTVVIVIYADQSLIYFLSLYSEPT